MAIAALKTYRDWKTCIEVDCGIRLSLDFVNARLAELGDVAHERTRRFVATWGEPHRRQVLAWFQQARDELSE